MLEQFFNPLIDWLHQNPNWAGAITFFISFIESLAIIGTIVPGSITMTAIGILIGTEVLPMTSTFIWAILGAIAGDNVSFWLGLYFKHHLREIWPFNHYPTLLAKGKVFFQLHGGKSVFIGRFTGPLRSIVPVVAGMLNMSQWRFLVANTFSAVGWSILYLTPGIILGTAAAELSPKSTTLFLLITLAGLCGLIIVSWLIKHMGLWTFTRLNNALDNLWSKMRQNQHWQTATKLLQNPHAPHEHGQLSLAIMSIVSLSLFFILCVSIVDQNILTSWNKPALELTQSLRTPTLNYFFTAFTFIADKIVVFFLVNIIFIYFAFMKQWRTAWHWLINGLVIIGIVYGLKHGINAPRPDAIQYIRTTGSFPSGHISLFLSVFGFLCYLICAPLNKAIQQNATIAFISIFILIVISRLYLGAHWLTDVIGAILLGLSWLLISIIAYRRYYLPSLRSKSLLITSASTILLTWSILMLTLFRKAYLDYLPIT